MHAQPYTPNKYYSKYDSEHLMIYCRVEKVNIRTKSGISKIGSVLLCMAGVAILAFYKGPQLQVYHLLSRYHHNNQQHEDHFSYNKKWILGSLLLFLATIMWSLWLVLQVPYLFVQLI
jgi:hypothetical protein